METLKTRKPDTLKALAMLTLLSFAWGVIVYGLAVFLTFKPSILTWSEDAFTSVLLFSLLIPLCVHIIVIVDSYMCENSIKEKSLKFAFVGISFLLLEFVCFSIYFRSTDMAVWEYYTREVFFCTLYLAFGCLTTALFMATQKIKKLFFTIILLCFIACSYLIFAYYLRNFNIAAWSSTQRLVFFSATLIGFLIAFIVAGIEKMAEEERQEEERQKNYIKTLKRVGEFLND